jgi:hypothetical protein
MYSDCRTLYIEGIFISIHFQRQQSWIAVYFIIEFLEKTESSD